MQALPKLGAALACATVLAACTLLAPPDSDLLSGGTPIDAPMSSPEAGRDAPREAALDARPDRPSMPVPEAGDPCATVTCPPSSVCRASAGTAGCVCEP